MRETDRICHVLKFEQTFNFQCSHHDIFVVVLTLIFHV